MKRPCTSMCEGCPLPKPYGDTHHLAYPAFCYKTKVERQWRELPANKIDICRCLHNAIHASGYTPEMPDRAEMLADIWQGDHEGIDAERDKQLFLGRLVLERGALPEESA